LSTLKSLQASSIYDLLKLYLTHYSIVYFIFVNYSFLNSSCFILICSYKAISSWFLNISYFYFSSCSLKYLSSFYSNKILVYLLKNSWWSCSTISTWSKVFSLTFYIFIVSIEFANRSRQSYFSSSKTWSIFSARILFYS